MKLTAEELEQRLTKLGFDKAKVQRLDAGSIEKQAEDNFITKPETAYTTGVAMALSGLGMVFTNPPLLGIGLLAAGGALLGYGISRQGKQHLAYLDRAEDLRQNRAQLRQDIARAQALIRTALPEDSSDDEGLVQALNDKVLRVNMPGMMEALERRIAQRQKEETEEDYSGTEWEKSVQHERDLKRVRNWADKRAKDQAKTGDAPQADALKKDAGKAQAATGAPAQPKKRRAAQPDQAQPRQSQTRQRHNGMG